MKKTTLQIIIILLSINLYAQKSRFEIGLQGGYYQANDYNKIKPGKNFSVDLKYFFTNKLFSFTDLAFPLKVGLGYNITNHINLSLI